MILQGAINGLLDSLGPLGVDRRDFPYCETYLVTLISAYDSGAISFVDEDCARAAAGGVEVAVQSRRRSRRDAGATGSRWGWWRLPVVSAPPSRSD